MKSVENAFNEILSILYSDYNRIYASLLQPKISCEEGKSRAEELKRYVDEKKCGGKVLG